MMTADEYRYMLDLKGLDDIQSGMCWPSVKVKKPHLVTARLVRRGWVRVVQPPEGHPTWPVYDLRTRGLRALTRESKRRALLAIARGRRRA